jgi:hypothetical protein
VLVDIIKYKGFLSNTDRGSEEPLDEGQEQRNVLTIDGYNSLSLENFKDGRLELFRIELFRNKLCDILGLDFYPGYGYLTCNKYKCHPFELTLAECPKKEANIGVFSYFKNVSEGYKYYKLKNVVRIELKSKDLLITYFESILNKVSKRVHASTYKDKIKHASYIKTKEFNFYVEPIGQGNMSVLIDGNGVAKALFDVGHGTPLNKSKINQGKYNFNSALNDVETVFLSHWDEDHYQLASHYNFDYLKKCYWYVPFSKDVILSNSVSDAIKYENRLLVWEMLLDITDNNKFYIINHSTNGIISLGAKKHVEYICGSKNQNSNNRGVVYALHSSFKYSEHQVLIPGDADYKYFQNWLPSSYTAVIATHHGSKNLSSLKPPIPRYTGAKFVLSFGFNDRYKHPSFSVIKEALKHGYHVYPTSLMNWRIHKINDKVNIYNHYAKSVKVI